MRSLSTLENTVLIQFISETKIKFPFGRFQDFFYLVFNKYVYELWHAVMNTHIIVRHLYMACAIYWEYIVWRIAITSKVASTLCKIQKISQLMTRRGCTTPTWLPGFMLGSYTQTSYTHCYKHVDDQLWLSRQRWWQYCHRHRCIRW